MFVNVGSHTGNIEVTGGRSDTTRGGGGAGGRIAVYHSTHDAVIPYRGNYNTQGGGAGERGEAGASGTAYIENMDTHHTTLRVDNRNQVDNHFQYI